MVYQIMRTKVIQKFLYKTQEIKNNIISPEANKSIRSTIRINHLEGTTKSNWKLFASVKMD
jgi:hypothetical protein